MSETPEYLTTKIWPTHWLVSSDEQCEFLSSYFVSSSILLSNSNTQSQRSIEWLTIGVFSASVGKYEAKNQWVSRDVRVMRFILVHTITWKCCITPERTDRTEICAVLLWKQNKTKPQWQTWGTNLYPTPQLISDSHVNTSVCSRHTQDTVFPIHGLNHGNNSSKIKIYDVLSALRTQPQPWYGRTTLHRLYSIFRLISSPCVYVDSVRSGSVTH